MGIRDFIKLMKFANLSEEEKAEWENKWDNFTTVLGDIGAEMVIEAFKRRFFPEEDFKNN